MNLLVAWAILTLAVWVTAAVLPGFHVKDVKGAIVVAAVFGLLNFALGWLFFVLLTIATLGLAWLFAFITRWLINTLLLKLTDRLTDALTIDSLGWAAGGALLISLISALVHLVLGVG